VVITLLSLVALPSRSLGAGETASRAEINSQTRQALKEKLPGDKVFLSHDASMELNRMIQDGQITLLSKRASKRDLSLARDRLNKFLTALVNNGEKAERGRVLITKDSFDKTYFDICPLAPWC
jgi:hypothetical protein